MTARLLQCPAALEHHQFEYNQQRVNRCSARSVRVCVRKAGRTAAWGCLRDAQHRSTCHTYTFTNIYKQQASAQLVSGINTSGACAVLCRTAPGGRAEPHVLWSKVEPLTAPALALHRHGKCRQATRHLHMLLYTLYPHVQQDLHPTRGTFLLSTAAVEAGPWCLAHRETAMNKCQPQKSSADNAHRYGAQQPAPAS